MSNKETRNTIVPVKASFEMSPYSENELVPQAKRTPLKKLLSKQEATLESPFNLSNGEVRNLVQEVKGLVSVDSVD